MNKSYRESLKKLEAENKQNKDKLKKMLNVQNDTLPVLSESRQEVELASKLAQNLFKPILDITKSIIVVTIPALIAVLNIELDKNIDKAGLVSDIQKALAFAILLHVITLAIQVRLSADFIENSRSRINLYTAFQQMHLVNKKISELEEKITDIVKKSKPKK